MLLRRLLMVGGGSFTGGLMATAGGLVYHNTTQVIVHNSATQFNLNTVQTDPAGYWVNTTTLEVPAGYAGLHLFVGQTWASGTVTADIHTFFKVNGAEVRLANSTNQTASADMGYMQAFAWLDLADGDTVEFIGYVDNSGTSKTFGHATEITAQTAVGWFKIT